MTQGDQNKIKINKTTIFFDAGIVDLKDVRSGQFAESSNSMFFVDTASSGIIEIVSVYINDNSQSVSNDISIGQIAFESISSGISEINFNRDSEMVNPDGDQIQIRHRGIGFINAK